MQVLIVNKNAVTWILSATKFDFTSHINTSALL